MSIKKAIVSLDQKYHAVMALVEKTKTKQQVLLELKIKPNTLNDWLRGKDKIVEQYNSSNSFTPCMKVKGAQHSQLDKALLEWFMNLRANKCKVNGPVIMAKADELAIKLGISGFSCGYGWLHRFKQRHSIVWQGREHGEADSVDENIVKKWKESKFKIKTFN